jgi:hypothetical protein
MPDAAGDALSGDGGAGDGFGSGDGFRTGDGFISDGAIDAPFDAADAGDLGRFDAADALRPDLSSCGPFEICGNGKDDDCNGVADCMDRACQPLPACIDKKQEQCTNKIDDDGNGLIDCADPACFGDRACFVPGNEICNNGLDDNDNGLIDCQDPQCFNNPVCKPVMGAEICDNGIDDNGDHLVDCADPQCKTFPACLHSACTPEIDFGTLAPHDARVTRTISTVGATAHYNTCASPGGTARVGQFVLSGPADLRIDVTQSAGAAHVVSVFRAGVDQACDQNLVNCFRLGQATSGTRTLPALGAGTYWVVVQSFAGTQGTVNVTLSTGKSITPEICNNGKDDDGNGLIDCADLACKNDPNCVTRECVPDFNAGALVPGAAGQTFTFNTNNFSDRYHPVCAGTSEGKDVAIRFTLHETATVNLSWNQASGDHFFTLASTPPPGQSCDANALRCFYPGNSRTGTVSYAPRPPGDYLFIFKPVQAGSEGQLTVTLFVTADRGTEICNNGIDDDGDGLVDCDDPDCSGVGDCREPICTPDVDLGDFDFGTTRSTNLDLRNAPDLYTTVCAKGDGKERVVRVNLLKVMALGVNCTETGDQVIELTQQVNPLDACDLHNWRCVDPRIFPSGCNWYFPNLQPGKYNLIVEAFQAGSEGTVDLTLTGFQEKVLEICNNGIDDDGDGFIDCADRKCVTDPQCSQFACRVDDRVGVVVLDGTTVTSAVVQTSNAGDDQQSTPCVSQPGGQDAVVQFELPAKTSLKIEWAQAGNHDFAIYQDTSDLLACDANPLSDCHKTNGASTGSYNVTLALGKYYLVVDADAPGKEGGVVLQFSGLPQ